MKLERVYERKRVSCFLGVLMMSTLLALSGARAASADQFVLTNSLQGRYIDLARSFSNQWEREITAETVRSLILDGETNPVLRHAGIKIGGAVITNTLRIGKPDFTGLQFDEILVDSSNAYPRTTLELLSDYSINGSQTLRAYEKSLIQRGLDDEATLAYLAARRYQRRSASPAIGIFETVFVDWLTGYGKHVERLMVACLLFICVGTLIFWEPRKDWRVPRQMQRASQERKQPRYNPIWFSLDAFLPSVGLGLYREWIPKEDRGWRWTYLRVHAALGWLLVPLLIAAAAGLFSK